MDRAGINFRGPSKSTIEPWRNTGAGSRRKQRRTLRVLHVQVENGGIGRDASTIYLEPVPDFSQPTVTEEGILLAGVADLVRMKLTSFRLRDKTHIADMDAVGLITPEIEAELSETVRKRLEQVRAEEP